MFSLSPGLEIIGGKSVGGKSVGGNSLALPTGLWLMSEIAGGKAIGGNSFTSFSQLGLTPEIVGGNTPLNQGKYTLDKRRKVWY